MACVITSNSETIKFQFNDQQDIVSSQSVWVSRNDINEIDLQPNGAVKFISDYIKPIFLTVDGAGNTVQVDTVDGLTPSDNQDLADKLSDIITGGNTVQFIGDLGDVDTSTSVPVTGDFLRWTGDNWVSSSSTELTGIPVSNNMVYAYDTTTQSTVATNTFQTVTFNVREVIEGWTYSAGTFTSQSGGAFMATFEFNVEKSGGGNVSCAVKVNKNGTEIAGSHNGMDVTANNTSFSVSRTFLFTTAIGDTITFLFSASSTNANIIPAPTPGGVTTSVGATLLIRRIV